MRGSLAQAATQAEPRASRRVLRPAPPGSRRPTIKGLKIPRLHIGVALSRSESFPVVSVHGGLIGLRDMARAHSGILGRNRGDSRSSSIHLHAVQDKFEPTLGKGVKEAQTTLGQASTGDLLSTSLCRCGATKIACAHSAHALTRPDRHTSSRNRIAFRPHTQVAGNTSTATTAEPELTSACFHNGLLGSPAARSARRLPPAGLS